MFNTITSPSCYQSETNSFGCCTIWFDLVSHCHFMYCSRNNVFGTSAMILLSYRIPLKLSGFTQNNLNTTDLRSLVSPIRALLTRLRALLKPLVFIIIILYMLLSTEHFQLDHWLIQHQCKLFYHVLYRIRPRAKALCKYTQSRKRANKYLNQQGSGCHTRQPF